MNFSSKIKAKLNPLKRAILSITFWAFIPIVMPNIPSILQTNYASDGENSGVKFEYSIFPIKFDQSKSSSSNTLEVKEDLKSESQFPSLPLEGEPKVVGERWVTTTAYSSTADQTDSTPFTTAWQTPVRDGVVAINFLPKGTMVKFPDMFGDKIFIVEDRMNARYKYRADIWMPTRQQAKEFGVKYLRMQVLGAQVDRDYVLKNFKPAFEGKI